MTEGDAAAREIVWRDFDRHAIAREHSDAVTPHITSQRREHFMTALDGHAERGVRQQLGDGTFKFDRVLLTHVFTYLKLRLGNAQAPIAVG